MYKYEGNRFSGNCSLSSKTEIVRDSVARAKELLTSSSVAIDAVNIGIRIPGNRWTAVVDPLFLRNAESSHYPLVYSREYDEILKELMKEKGLGFSTDMVQAVTLGDFVGPVNFSLGEGLELNYMNKNIGTNRQALRVWQVGRSQAGLKGFLEYLEPGVTW